jgi:hypothetical protein
MPAFPAVPVPMLSPGEMQLLLSRTGLVLNPGQVADLVLAWRQVAGLIAGMPRERPLTDDMSVAFRLTPPAPTPSAAGSKVMGANRSKAKSSTRRSGRAVKAKTLSGKPKTKPKRRPARSAGRKSGQRR